MHSLHAYFLRRGDFNAPIVYQVDRSLDGHSFSNRRVVAIQHGQQIFNMAASFQTHGGRASITRSRCPQVPPPESLADYTGPPPELLARLPERVRRFFEQPRPFEFRMVQPIDYLHPQRAPPAAPDLVPRRGRACRTDEMLHRRLLAYVSDFFLLDTATLPHGTSFLKPSIMMASIDHAMWFHRPLRVDDWLLYAMESPSASGARGFARASVFARDGRLVASAAQEGLVRMVKDLARRGRTADACRSLAALVAAAAAADGATSLPWSTSGPACATRASRW